MTNKTTAGILGGGISGLATAWYLEKRGIDTTVYEKNASAGGVIQTEQSANWLVEKGPNTLMVRSGRIWNLLDELGLDTEIARAGNKAKKRFIVKDGKPVPLPTGLSDFLKTGLLSPGAKLRLLAEPFIAKGNTNNDESVADFIRRRLGKEVLDYGINPFVAGIYAGTPERLSAKHTFPALYQKEKKYGSLLQGFIRERNKWKPKPGSRKKALISFNDGLQTLPLRLSEKLGASVRTNAEITGIEYENETWRLNLKDGEKSQHRVLISTLPARALERLLPNSFKSPSQGASLEKLSYAPICILALGFRREQVGHPLDGFGMLVPGSEPFDLLGTLFSSSLFPGRAPEKHVLLTTFAGGTRNPQQASLSGDELLSTIIPELSHLLNIEGSPVFTSHWYHQQAIPQYELGYDRFLDTMEKVESEFPGFFVRGNIRDGVSVPDCILSAFETAKHVEMFMSTDTGTN